jgi:3-oxoacyl-[acyl-carrier protein] reductase
MVENIGTMVEIMTQKIVVIAGSTSIIGTSCTKLLSQNESLKLILLGRDQEILESLSKRANNAEFYITDFIVEASIKESINNIIKNHEKIDSIIYNVAIYPWEKIEDLSLDEWKKALDVNLTGAFLLSKFSIPIMKKHKSGKFIFLSNIAGENLGLPNMSAYAASKSGLNGFMRTLALELAPFNINVNSISPGKIYNISNLTEEETQQKTESIPLGRFIRPEDIAYMVEFLISNKAQNITGQNFIIDGGQSIS